ncbi:PREDICTED: uncharacterized protein LOC102030526 [Chinchilla lanigera]|uniref:uncharacterized protein LOC102030526 n=1 Tax=Chinchilla lanigera TaxID=34839 RepID=UPI000697B2BE|nr:PREDICTED: uncharacterized protein LOC102030526 [Chinchilla lanigera]
MEIARPGEEEEEGSADAEQGRAPRSARAVALQRAEARAGVPGLAALPRLPPKTEGGRAGAPALKFLARGGPHPHFQARRGRRPEPLPGARAQAPTASAYNGGSLCKPGEVRDGQGNQVECLGTAKGGQETLTGHVLTGEPATHPRTYRSLALGQQYTSLGSQPLLCGSIPGLVPKQLRFCRNYIEIMPSVAEGVKLGIQECQHQFRGRRWNCTTIDDSLAIFGPVLDKGMLLVRWEVGRRWGNSVRVSAFALQGRTVKAVTLVISGLHGKCVRL